MEDKDLVVETKDGKLRGFVSVAGDKSAKPVYNFLNIPFGKPPTGKRRFRPPEKNDPWDGIRDATTNMCHPIQDATVARRYDAYLPVKHFLGATYDKQDEDCLQLNVFTPMTKSSAKLPVMVWVVGGAFMRGSAGSYDGSALSGMNDVTVVAPNYRINALGFLSLGQGTKCAGNNGLLDLILALKWVRDHIRDFGGDPENVTIFGESAGACLVELLTMSPLAEGLFHKAIALSGSTLCFNLFGDGEFMRDRYLSDLGIPLDDEPDVILEKLQSLPISRIIEVQRPYEGLFTFKPNIDGYAMTDHPQNIVKSGKAKRVPLISGVCDCEGGGLLNIREPDNFFSGCSEEDISKMFTNVVKLQYPGADTKKAVKMLIQAYSYLAEENDKMKYSKIFSQVLADVIFIIPAVMSLTSLSARNVPTYMYVLAKQLEYNHSETNGPEIKNKPDYVTCDHGDTCHFIWGMPFVKGDLPGEAWFTESDKEVSRVTMKYLTNFAKTGNPNEGVAVPRSWPQYNPKSREALLIDDQISIVENYGMRSVKLHTEEIPEIMKTFMNG